LASFVADMLKQGTKTRSAIQLSEDVDSIGATLKTGSGFDAVSTDLVTLTKNTQTGFELLSDVVIHPAFDEKETERLRGRRLTSLIQRRDNPDLVRAETMFNVLYGETSAYGYDSLGTEASNKKITRSELAEFWRSGFVPANSALVVAGDVTPS